MLLLRDVARGDLAGLKRLAATLNSVNLPNNEKVLSALIDKSIARASRGRSKTRSSASTCSCSRTLATRRIIGTSMIIAQHGTKDAPHIYFEVTEAENYSATLDKHFRHKVLSIGYNYDGPTEIGGLVVDPPYRSGTEQAGQAAVVRALPLHGACTGRSSASACSPSCCRR